MPLIVTDFSWTQTDTTVYIQVPLKGVKIVKVDIVSTEEYLKVHYPPYLFEAFLFEAVDDDRSSAKVGDGVAIITLPKKINKTWTDLMITSDKEKKKEIRERALIKYREKLSSESKSKAQKKHAEKKYALETMMKLEQEERDNIEKMKEAEREKTTAELDAWRRKEKEKAKAEEVKVKPKQENGRLAARSVKVDQRSKKKQEDLPAPRRAGNIRVAFTPRVFPTALRESKIQEEEEWLKKQAEARRAANADVDEELTDEQRNPDWLKDKGDKYFATGDYLSAVNVYNLAIRLNRKIPALFSNRAACHLKLRNLHKAVEDSSQALDLLTPPVDANAAARARAHVRRGSAFCQLQLYAEGLQDYQAALNIDPHNEALKTDAQKIRNIIQSSVLDPDE